MFALSSVMLEGCFQPLQLAVLLNLFPQCYLDSENQLMNIFVKGMATINSSLKQINKSKYSHACFFFFIFSDVFLHRKLMFVSYSLPLPSKQKLKHTKLHFLACCYSE